MSRIDFDRVNAAALAYSETLVRFLAPDGRCNGNEYFARNPTRADRSIGSFSVNLRSGKWYDRATAQRRRGPDIAVGLRPRHPSKRSGEGSGRMAARPG